MTKLDEAVIKLLKLNPSATSVTPAGGGGCSSASTSKITAKDEDGNTKYYFMKSGTGKDAEMMFQGLFSVQHSQFKKLTQIARGTLFASCYSRYCAKPMSTILWMGQLLLKTIHLLLGHRLS
jgi:hypothetical protein